jgi:periplasmic divalent cation tolerance protein
MTMPTDYQIIFCTCPDNATAEKIAHLLIENNLAACVNIVPNIRSIYRWQGQIECAEEVLLLIKAHQASYSALENLIKTHHPYQLPEIIAIAIERGLPDYLNWIASCH